MRRLLRIILWMVKGVLLVIALGALVMWPVSQGRSMALGAESFDTGPDWGQYRWRHARCQSGGLAVACIWQHHSGAAYTGELREQFEAGSRLWQWNGWWLDAAADGTKYSVHWGPLRWSSLHEKEPGETFIQRRAAAPLWLIALVTGFWPLASIAFALRRRAKRRRAAREGRCTRCGYDLRATPAAGGDLLPVCPECGKESPAGNKPSPPPS